MKILVTGGAGFIASNLVDKLVEKGHDVSILDNLSTGKKENLNPKAKFYKADVRDKSIENIFKKGNFDIVSHHAAQIDVRKSVADPYFDAEINIMGLLNVLKNCARFKVKKIINVSSGGVIYKDNAKLPINEDETKGPISPYGIAKLTSEYYVKFYSSIYGLKFTSLRYANVYGPRQDPKGEAGVIAIFSNLMLQGKQPKIFGDGKQTRDYVYVKDVVDANILATEKGDDEAFNIGTGIETDVNKIFSVIKKATGYSGNPSYLPARPGELTKSCLNISKAKKILGWQPKYTIEQGLRETIDWVKATVK